MTSNSAGPPPADSPGSAGPPGPSGPPPPGGASPWDPPHPPTGHPGAPRPAPPARGRRRLPWALGAGAAAVVLLGTTAFLVFSGDEGPPEDLTSLYATDFATNPQWSDSVHDPEEDPYASGHLPGEGHVMAYDPAEESDPWSGAVFLVPSVDDGDLPPSLMVEADVRILEGYEYLSFGVECTDEYHEPGTDPEDTSDDPVHHATYRISVRADGERADLTRNTPDTDGSEELASGPVPGFEPYPAVTGDTDEGDDPASNNVKLSCDSEAPDGDSPGRTTVTAWVNDQLVAQAVDENAAPAGHDGHELVRKQRIAYDRGQGEGPLRVLFEDYRLYEVGDRPHTT